MSTDPAGGPALTCTDWRGWSATHIGPLLDSEAERWAHQFHWDQRWSFTHVESARESGQLPGFVATDPSGVTRGWTFFLRHHDQLQIGTVVSESAVTTRALIDAVFASPLAHDASVVLFSPDAPGLADALHAHGLRTEPYDYLVTETTGAAASVTDDSSMRSFEPVDVVGAARLLGAAYAMSTFLRPFVPMGEPGEWLTYAAQLVETRGCGEFLAAASVVLDGLDDEAGHGQLRGALFATQLSHDTGHIAQLVVRPGARGAGSGRRMLAHTLRALQLSGVRRVSLLVARTNEPARRLYASTGFLPAGEFLTGLR